MSPILLPRPLGRKRVRPVKSDIATFTHAKQTGCKIPAELAARMRGTLAGQDYVVTIHPQPSDSARQTITITLDGHGAAGELYAAISGEHLGSSLQRRWREVQSICSAGDEPQLTALLTQLFLSTDKMLQAEVFPAYPHGGCTATVLLIVDGKHFVTANVGDTAAMLAYADGGSVTLTTSHSADCPREYERYRKRCTRDGVSPQEFVFQRFNCPGGPRLPGPRGDFSPLSIFSLDADNNATINEENCCYVESLGMIDSSYYGGTQTVRKHVIKDKAGNVVGTEKDKRHCNWGSTVAGRGQNTRVLGDFIDKHALHLDAEPSVRLEAINPSRGEVCVLVASDGVTDAHWFGTLAEQLSSGVANKDDAQGVCRSLIASTLENAKDAGFEFSKNQVQDGQSKQLEYPAWDDLSATVIVFSPEQEVVVEKRVVSDDPSTWLAHHSRGMVEAAVEQHGAMRHSRHRSRKRIC